MRITSGELRGREIRVPDGLRTRPTGAKLRAALFNSIQTRLPDARVLDLFAGSGALGFEALSRGAREAVFVENAPGALACLRKNVVSLGVSARARVLAVEVEAAWATLVGLGPFDVVLADPPYAGGWEPRLLASLGGEGPTGGLVASGGVLCLEWGRLKTRAVEGAQLADLAGSLVKIREKNYGDSVLTTYLRPGAGPEAP